MINNGDSDGQGTAGGKGMQPGEIIHGHSRRYEYFNYYDNATYSLNHYCMEHAFPQDKYGCGYDSPRLFQPKAITACYHTQFRNDGTFNFLPLPGHDLHSWTVLKKQMDVDWIVHGRGATCRQQKRRLGQDQGLIVMPEEYVDDTCSHYCPTELLLLVDPTMKSDGRL